MPARKRATFSWSRRSRPGSSRSSVRASRAPQATDCGSPLEKSCARERCSSSSAERLAPGDEAARRAAQRLAEGAGDHVDPPGEAEVLRDPGAGFAEDADPVRVVDDQGRVVARRQLDQVGQGREFALHAEDAVGDDPAARAIGNVGQPPLERADVGVLVNRLAAGPGEPDPVDDRCVVELVGEDPGALVADRVEQRLVGGRVVVGDPDRPGVAEIDLHAPALLPDDYVPDPHLRLVLYKRIAGARDQAELDELYAEVIDRFGALPPADAMLFKVTALKQLAGPLGVRKIDAGPKGAKIEFNARPNVDPAHLIALLQSAPRIYRLEGGTRLRITQDMPTGDARVTALSALLKKLGATG